VEPSYDILVPVAEGQPLQELLDSSFNAEVFEGDNKYHCSECNGKVERAEKKTLVDNAPQFLKLTLNRFSFSGLAQKKLDRIDIPLQISLN